MATERVPLHRHPRAAEQTAAGATGFVLVLAGGGYAHRSDHEGPGVVDFLASHGIPAASLDYPVAPARHPDALEQVLLALADLRAGVHGDVTGPLAVVGFSAGGHLAGTAATATDAERALVAARAGLDPATVRRPDLLTLAYPVASLVHRTHIGSRLNLLGEDAPEELAAGLSLERRADAGVPPLLCWHTADDDAVPVQNSLLAAAAWRDAGAEVELHVYPTGRHGLGLAAGEPEPVASWPATWLAWLARHGVHPAG